MHCRFEGTLGACESFSARGGSHLSCRKRPGEPVEEEGQFEESKVFYLAALEGSRRVLREEHKITFASLNNLGVLFR